MIKKVITKNIKGSSFEMDVERLTLFTGKVGSGKTTVANAIAITLLGYYPAGTETIKQNGAIFDAFSSDPETMTTGVVLDNGTRLERSLTKTKSGSVTEKLTINGKKVTKPEYSNAIYSSGLILFDVGLFTEASNQKKAEIIFSMFSVTETFDIETRIEDARDGIKRMQETIRGIDRTIEQQRVYRSSQNPPPGNVAQIRDIISTAEVELEAAIRECEAAKISEARFRKEQEESLQSEQQQPAAAPSLVDDTVPAPEEQPIPAKPHTDALITDGDILNKPAPLPQVLIRNDATSPKDSIIKIIDAMVVTGCSSTCFAVMVAKQELRKYAA
ncbi:AAA family ATPase [Desulforegula conservatrix]|uniref:AAA family ATPase n=1 Tax=Desulforegula conservatrix TaxID=153026 RepID=UPI00042A86C0|nr:AAA family ATPase [Desulforegula conservatrix]